MTVEELINAFLSFFTFPSIAFLEYPGEFITSSCNLVPFIISDFAPLHPSISLKLLPFAFDYIPIDSHYDVSFPLFSILNVSTCQARTLDYPNREQEACQPDEGSLSDCSIADGLVANPIALQAPKNVSVALHQKGKVARICAKSLVT